MAGRDLDLWPPASSLIPCATGLRPYRRNVGGHPRVPLALRGPRLTPAMGVPVPALSLPAPCAGCACTPGPLDPGNIHKAIYIYERHLHISHSRIMAPMWEGAFRKARKSYSFSAYADVGRLLEHFTKLDEKKRKCRQCAPYQIPLSF